MKIGFTLPISFLTGDFCTPDTILWQDMYGDASTCLSRLKELGVTSVELRGLGETTTQEEMDLALRVILDHKLQPTIHAWLPLEFTHLFRLIDQTEKTLEQCDAHLISEVPIVVHSYSHKEVTHMTHETTAFSETVKGLKILQTNLDTRKIKFTLALEVNRDLGQGEVGTSFDSVTHMVKETGMTQLGMCWDFGHCLANHHVRNHPLWPPEEFLSRVSHTHIHQIGDNGRTHSYISPDDSYLAHCLRRLMSVGYSGVFNLELYPIRWEHSPGFCKKKLEESVTNLAKLLSEN